MVNGYNLPNVANYPLESLKGKKLGGYKKANNQKRKKYIVPKYQFLTFQISSSMCKIGFEEKITKSH